MDYLGIVELKKDDVLQSWEIFKSTGDIYDAMELMHDFRALDLLLEGDYFERE